MEKENSHHKMKIENQILKEKKNEKWKWQISLKSENWKSNFKRKEKWKMKMKDPIEIIKLKIKF